MLVFIKYNMDSWSGESPNFAITVTSPNPLRQMTSVKQIFVQLLSFRQNKLRPSLSLVHCGIIDDSWTRPTLSVCFNNSKTVPRLKLAWNLNSSWIASLDWFIDTKDNLNQWVIEYGFDFFCFVRVEVIVAWVRVSFVFLSLPNLFFYQNFHIGQH